MRRSLWIRVLAVVLVISMLAAPVSAAAANPVTGRTEGLIGSIIAIIRDIIRDIWDSWFDGPGEEVPEPTVPGGPGQPTAPTDPAEPDPTEPGETDPTEPGETDPTEPGETDPTEPGETEPEAGNDLTLIEGHANVENGQLLRGVTYSLAETIAAQKHGSTTAVGTLSAEPAKTVAQTTLGGLKTMAAVPAVQPMAESDAEGSVVYQASTTAVTDLGLTNVGDSAMFVIVSNTSGKEMVANVGTNSNNQTGFELADRSDVNDVAAEAVWTITKVETGYTVSNGGLNVAVKADHQVALEEDAVVQIQAGTSTDYWVIHSDGWCLNDHNSFSGAFADTSGTSDALSTYTNLEGGRSMLELYSVTQLVTEPEEPEEPVVDPSDSTRDIPVSVLTATAGNSQDGQVPENTLDSSNDTLWHTSWNGSDRDTHWIQFQLSAEYNVDGLRYLPRQGSGDGDENGRITEYEIQISDDGQTFTSVATGTWSYDSDQSWRIATFDAVNAKYVRLVVIDAQSNSTTNLYASAAEIRLTGEVIETTEPEEPEEPEQPETGYEVVRFPVTMFNYNEGNDDTILYNLTHKAEIEAGFAEKELWEGLYFSGGTPAPTSYSYSTTATAYTDLTWQQVMDGTYYADEACTEQVTVEEVSEGGSEWNAITITATSDWIEYPEYADGNYYYKDGSDYELITDTVTYAYGYWYVYTGENQEYHSVNATELTIYTHGGEPVDYKLVAGGETLKNLGGTDLSAKVGIPLYSGGRVEVSKAYARWNFWAYRTADGESTDNQNKFYAGLVQDELVNGEIKFNVVEPGIFTFDPDHPEITKDEVKDIYQNVGLPFVKNEKGYYTFDSDAHGTYFSDTTGDGKSDPGYGASDNYFDMYFDYQNTQGWSGMYYGDSSTNLWAPYNTNANDTGEGAIDYHFGMRADIPFSMTSNGRIKSTDDNSEPITFTFQGDDDVWIFIDGHLVIDLGGIHNRLGATIDFANNTITYFLPESNNNTAEFGAYGVENFEMVQKLYNDTAGEGALGQTRFDFSSEEEHEMSIFYLERGKGTSNCKIEFNLPMRDTLLITKDATQSWSEQQDANDGEGEENDGTAPLTKKEQAAVDNILFGFTLYKKNHDDDGFAVVANTNYFIQDKEGNIVGSGSTDGNGHFNLKNGQTAKFMTDFPKEGVTYYVVEDEVPEGFLTPDYNYAGVATDGFDYIGKTLGENDQEVEVSGHVSNAGEIGEQELHMEATKNKSYEITAYGSIESIDSLEFIAVNYLDAELPNPSAFANEDIIVIDYGLPVKIDPLANDLFRGDNIEIVAWGDETLKLNEVVDSNGNATDATSWTDENRNFHSGTVKFNDRDYPEEADVVTIDQRDSFEYTLTKQLTEVETIHYIIKVTSNLDETINGELIETKTACRYSLAKVYIVPATIMYYEENFSDMIHFEGSGWDKESTVDNQINVSDFQEPGVVGTIGDSTYGSDLAYLSDNGDSNGTYRFGDTTNKAVRFTYTFTGTGTSIFARTSAETGYMQVKLYRGVGTDATLEYTTYRDTYWKDENDTNEDDAGTLYNIPVYSTNENLDYDTYTVVCTIAKAGTPTDGNLEGAGNEFYLDGIRIMRPLNVYNDTVINEESGETITDKALAAYATDGEANLDVVTLRQKLLTDYYTEPEGGEENTEEVWPFAVMTDVNDQIVLASDYYSIGPKNEVYLSKDTGMTNGQTVSFSLKYWQTEGLKLYMGMKAPFGHAKVNVGAETIELKNAPDCYYDVTNNQSKLEAVYVQAETEEGYLIFTDADGREVYMDDSGYCWYKDTNADVAEDVELTPVNSTTVDYYIVTYTFEAAESIVSLTNIKVVGTHEFVIIENTDEKFDGNEGGNG